jgi:hypothetical protein
MLARFSWLTDEENDILAEWARESPSNRPVILQLVKELRVRRRTTVAA